MDTTCNVICIKIFVATLLLSNKNEKSSALLTQGAKICRFIG